MLAFVLVVFLVIFIMALSLVRSWVENGQRLSSYDDERSASMETEVSRLKNRVNVLERLYTDDEVELRKKFRRL